MSKSHMPGLKVNKTTPHSLTDSDADESVVSTASSVSDEEFESQQEALGFSVDVTSPDRSSDKANAKQVCPKPVHYIINALSAAGTFGGLALIITGGMGTTLHKPSDDPIANGAMLLSGGTLLAGSFLGGLHHMSGRAPAQ